MVATDSLRLGYNADSLLTHSTGCSHLFVLHFQEQPVVQHMSVSSLC